MTASSSSPKITRSVRRHGAPAQIEDGETIARRCAQWHNRADQEGSMRQRWIVALFFTAAVAATAGQQAPQRTNALAPEGTPIPLGLAGYAKVLCSAVFVSGREPAEAFRNSGFFLFPDDQRAGVTYSGDRDRKLVRMTHGATTRTAKLYGDQGCIIHPQNHDGIFYPDHTLIYTGAIDAFKHSMTRPQQFPPDTEGRYRNSDPLMIGWLIKQAVTRRGEEYLTYPQRALFDRIGIRRQVLETDPYGNFLLTGYDYGTPRNWARIGLLYLQDGMWQGQRLLPEGWATFVSTPAPAWKRPVYGGLFWVNGDGAWPIPKSAYFANGAGGQRTIIIPTHDLVVVRMGHHRGERAGMRALRASLAELMLAVKIAD
jgi:hypothetical protein